MLIVEVICFIVLIVLLCRNLIMICKGGVNPELNERLRLRLLVCKRVALANLLIVGFQGYQISVHFFYIISTGVPVDSMLPQLSWQFAPIFFGILIMSFGMIQYLIIDTIRQYKSSSLQRNI